MSQPSAGLRRQRVLSHLQGLPGSWISAPGIARALGYSTHTAGHIREDLSSLQEHGLVVSRSACHDSGLEYRASGYT